METSENVTDAINNVQHRLDDGLTAKEISIKLSMPLNTVHYIIDNFIEEYMRGLERKN